MTPPAGALSPETRARITEARTVRGTGPGAYQVEDRSIGALLVRQTAIDPEAPWLAYYPDAGEPLRWSYGEFLSRVESTADALLAAGICRGDRIATVSHNHADTVVQYFAAWRIGAVVVPVNIGEDDKRIGYILENSRTRLVFVRDAYAGRIRAILPAETGVRIVEVGPGAPRFEAPSGLPRPEVGPDDEALIVYTSGTTGLPKGVVLSQYNLLVDAKEIAAWHRLAPGDRMMCVLPIHHVNGTVVTLMTPLWYRGSVVLHQKFHSERFFPTIASEKVHVVSVVPTLLQFLLHDREKHPAVPIEGFRHIICGAGPLTVELAQAFEAVFQIPIVHGYGLSETTCYSCFLPLDLSAEEHRQWLGAHGFPSIGVPIPCNEMAIHDDQGRPLGEGEKGEIVIRGHNVMQCYFNDPAANEKTFAFGWFRSGDEGFWRKDALGRPFFFITGRIKELIIRGGTNISPFEIDEVLMNMPGVKAGIAVGFENDWYGEEVGAYVQRAAGSTVTEAEVVAYCRKAFSYQKCPKVVLFGDDIPVTSTGKYQRNKLKPLFAAWKATQFTESRPRS
jgi:long-chain acyl-CoA synthetase